MAGVLQADEPSALATVPDRREPAEALVLAAGGGFD